MTEKVTDKGTEKGTEKVTDKGTEKGTDKVTDKVTDKDVQTPKTGWKPILLRLQPPHAALSVPLG